MKRWKILPEFDPHLRKMRIVGHLVQHRKPVINMESLTVLETMLVQPENVNNLFTKNKSI